MEENSNKALYIGIGIILCVAVIGVAIFFYNKSHVLSTSASKSIDTLSTSINSSNYSEYDDTEVTGNQVSAAISQFASPSFAIKVETLGNASGKTYKSKNAYSITDISSSDYIEGSGTFKSKLVKSSNGTVVGITFTQK